jgi:beta-phosphoglucomutase
MEIKGFIFDVDGVLTDTVEPHYQSWVRLAKEEGIAIPSDFKDQVRGLTRPASLRLFLADREVPEEVAQDYLRRKNDYFLESLDLLTEKDMLPGVRGLMEALSAAGIPIAIGSASRNAREVVRRLGIDDFISAYADGHSVERSKPAPDVFLEAARLLGIEPEGCVVVEDAEVGIEAAHAAGMRVIGVGPRERLGEADLVVDSLEGLSLAQIRGSLAFAA